MIVISVLYPAGHAFDMDYYRKMHLPLVRRLLGPMGMTELGYYCPAEPAPYQVVAELRFDSRERADAALAAHGAETQADIANFTAAPPTILIGEFVSG